MGNVRISDIAKFLCKEYHGKDHAIFGVCPLNDIRPQSMVFALRLEDITGPANILVIAPKLYESDVFSYITSDTPKFDFARAFAKFFPPDDVETYINKSFNQIVEEGAVVSNAQIGFNCLIKSNAVIGRKGFSFIRDELGVPFPMPHKGEVILGDNVEIGACTTVVRGVLSDTIIGNNVKIDDHVHIAHNVQIGDNTMIAACTEISGSVKIGKNVWIGPNCSILNHVEIGDGAFINISSTVVKDYKPNLKEIG